jgi:hypothetical protein
MGSTHEDFIALLDWVLAEKASCDAAAGQPHIKAEYLDPSVVGGSAYRSIVRAQRYAFPIVVESKAAADIDRRGSMLSGPFFSSAAWPWPETDGFSWEPIAQIDLEHAGRVRGSAVGRGLVQVWKCEPRRLSQDPADYQVRHIPAEHVSHELQPLPMGLRCDAAATHAWRAEDASPPPWLYDGLQITATRPARLSLNELSDECLRNDLVERESEYPAELVARARQVVDAFAGQSHRDGDYLFGNFHPIQFGPYLAPLLLNLGTEHFSWGDEGSAQLFFTEGADDGGCWFDWSC